MATRQNRDIPQISNEYELGLIRLPASELIRRNQMAGSRLSLVHEVNGRHMVELNVSLKKNVTELNSATWREIRATILLAARSGKAADEGLVYGGGAVLNNTEGIVPRLYLTTAASEGFGRAMTTVKSQQIVLGVSDEAAAFRVYNALRLVSPIVLALSASSPLIFEGGRIANAGVDSIRMQQYAKGCARFPAEMWLDPPTLGSIADYNRSMAIASQRFRDALPAMDSRPEFRTMYNSAGIRFCEQERLEPHQVFWQVRPRPDHRNDRCALSIEVRSPDLPFSLSEMQTINRFVYGVACIAASSNQQLELPSCLEGSFVQHTEAARLGLRASLNGTGMGELVKTVLALAIEGLNGSGYSKEAVSLEAGIGEILGEGNGAQRLLRALGNDLNPETVSNVCARVLRRGW
ncbi:MAG TPA: hypothetical protein VMV00_03150 [Candidatus Baltobacteraceae bacterium]|nr:hypothetical protein [Candidatus Baltobacteraceae bacterium]